MKLWLVKHQGYSDIEEAWQESLLGVFESEDDVYKFLNTTFGPLVQVFLDNYTIAIKEIKTNMGYNGFFIEDREEIKIPYEARQKYSFEEEV